MNGYIGIGILFILIVFTEVKHKRHDVITGIKDSSSNIENHIHTITTIVKNNGGKFKNGNKKG